MMTSEFIRIANILVRREHILALKMTEMDEVTPQWESTYKMKAWLRFGPTDEGQPFISWTNNEQGKGHFPDAHKLGLLAGFTRFGAWSIRTDDILWVRINSINEAIVCVKIDPPRHDQEFIELHVDGAESVKPLLSFLPMHHGPAQTK